jgi:AcrR family transcriptional regulator
MTTEARKSYHHGNLYKTLLQTGEEWIRTRGMEAFSLRACAKAAGVAHSAPGHYFKEVGEIFTEIGVRTFERLADFIIQSKQAEPDADPLFAVCSAYVQFARQDPKLFQMLFHSDRINRGSERFQRAGELAFRELALAIDPDPKKRQPNHAKILFAWSQIHGLAMLSIDGPMAPVGGNRSGLNEVPIVTSLRRLVEVVRNWN